MAKVFSSLTRKILAHTCFVVPWHYDFLCASRRYGSSQLPLIARSMAVYEPRTSAGRLSRALIGRPDV